MGADGFSFTAKAAAGNPGLLQPERIVFEHRPAEASLLRAAKILLGHAGERAVTLPMERRAPPPGGISPAGDPRPRHAKPSGSPPAGIRSHSTARILSQEVRSTHCQVRQNVRRANRFAGWHT